MRFISLQRRHSRLLKPHPRSHRPDLELLESRLVPSTTIDHSGGFASHSDLTNNGSASFPGSVAQLTDGQFNEAGSIFTTSTVDVTQFSTTFTFLLNNPTDPFADGITFTIQASPSGSAALGQSGSGLAYQGILNSVAIKFDLYNSSGEGTNSTGIFTNGRPPTIRDPGLGSEFPDMSVSLDGTGIDLHSRHPMQVSLSYDGSTLTESIQDTVTGKAFTQTYSVKIPSIIGGNTAYVGFTGATGGLAAVQDVQTWQGTFGPETPTSPIISSLSPSSAQQGSGSFPLTVNGTNFVPGATVLWTANGMTTPLPTTFLIINGTQQLLANVDSSLLTTPGTASVSVIQVVNGSSLTSNTLAFTITPTSPTSPIISSLTPSSAQEGSGSFTLTVNGFGFGSGSTVLWTQNGTTTPVTTIFVSSNQLLAVVPSSLVAEESTAEHGGPISVSVSNGAGFTSSAVPFTITEAPLSLTAPGATISAPALQAITPTLATFSDTGGPEPVSDYSASIDWGDAGVTAGTITANSDGSFSVSGTHAYTAGGTYSIVVTISHETAPQITATVTANISASPFIFPSISSISPSSVQAGSSGFTLTVMGSNFDSTATVNWAPNNGSPIPLTTTFVSAGELTAFVPSSLLASSGTASVTVSQLVNGSTRISNAATFSITPVSTTITATGLNISAVVNVAQDFMVAQFTDSGPDAQPGAYAVPIAFGDSTPLQAGRVTQPGGPGTPFFVDATHTYTATGTFTVLVRIFKEIAGYAQTSSTATVTGGGGGGAAAFVGRNPLLGALGVQTVELGSPLTVSSKSGPQVPIQSPAAAQSGQPSTAGDLYWQLVGRGRLIPGSLDWVPDTLALNVEGISR